MPSSMFHSLHPSAAGLAFAVASQVRQESDFAVPAGLITPAPAARGWRRR